MQFRPMGLVERYPLQVFFSVASVLTGGATLAFIVGAIPGVTYSERNLIRLVSLTLVLALFAIGFWAGPVFERYLGGRKR